MAKLVIEKSQLEELLEIKKKYMQLMYCIDNISGYNDFCTYGSYGIQDELELYSCNYDTFSNNAWVENELSKFQEIE